MLVVPTAMAELLSCKHWVIKKCRLSWLTNSALVTSHLRLNAGGGGLQGLSPRVQLYIGDLTPYLTSGCKLLSTLAGGVITIWA